MNYIEPKLKLTVYTCPHCQTISQHEWQVSLFQEDINEAASQKAGGQKSEKQINHTSIARCISCGNKSLWQNENLVYPLVAIFPKPNSEMSISVLSLYNEAGEISNKSPRGACALLRLAIQLLCKELGEEGKDINTDVKNLVKKGLPEIVKQSLDIVRVVGNKAAHPGQIELDVDNPETAESLFELVNLIVEYMIAMPKRVRGMYNKLPNGAKDAIEKRDS